MIWVLDSHGRVQCQVEVADRLGAEKAELWSIVDLFVSLRGTIRLVHELWVAVGFFGTGN